MPTAELGQASQPAAYTLPQLARSLGAPYRTLHSWVERGLLNPSIHRARGTGRANLFDIEDALAVCVLMELRDAGVKFDLLAQAANELRQRRGQLSEPVFVLVNGKVDVVSDPLHATQALARGGLTLAYNTELALQRVAEIEPS